MYKVLFDLCILLLFALKKRSYIKGESSITEYFSRCLTHCVTILLNVFIKNV